jgi:hypothetical protein
MPGTFPKPQGNRVLSIENFDERTFCEEIGREAWGYVDYFAPLHEETVRSYEMVKGGVHNDKGV